MDLPGYDRWKLASPPEYEWGPGEEEAEYEHQVREYIDELMQAAETHAEFAEIIRLAASIGDDITLPPTLEEALASPPRKIDVDAEDDPADLEIVF